MVSPICFDSTLPSSGSVTCCVAISNRHAPRQQTQHTHPQYSIDCFSIEHLSEGTRNAPWGWQFNAETYRIHHTQWINWMNNWCICWFYMHIFIGDFKGTSNIFWFSVRPRKFAKLWSIIRAQRGMGVFAACKREQSRSLGASFEARVFKRKA
jgi:hypothetical protein